MIRPLLLLVLTSCASDQERFSDDFAASYCARVRSCDERVFWTTWDGGTPECRDHARGRLRQLSFGNGNVTCRWQPEPALDCLEDVERGTCDEILREDYISRCARPAWDCITLIRARAGEPD